jgi:tRNA-2-methylthio-N6-dimethylallyladenosine synthase
MNYFIQTHGCQMNYSDTERVKSMLESVGFQETSDIKDADVIIFNTCSVKQKAEDKVCGEMKNLRKLHKAKPGLKVGITGCMVRKTSNRDSEEKDRLLGRLKEIDFVFRIEDLWKLPEVIGVKDEGSLENYFKIQPKYSSKFQAFVPTGTGCDKFCTYCIVPYARGREKSRFADEIFAECEELVENGCKEITLLGQTVDSYGLSPIDQKTGKFEKKNNFVKLLERIDGLKGKGLARLRFTSPHPKDFTDELIESFAKLETLMPYIHLPVQSGDDEVLKRMNRSYGVKQFVEIIKKIREKVPHCAVSTDMIVGFCGETDEEFENTYKMYEELEFDHCYISRYSPRKGTVSEKTMEDDVAREQKAKRWHRLNDLLVEIADRKLKEFVGKEVKVLVEECKDGVLKGRSEHFKKVQFEGDEKLVGEIVPVKVKEAKNWVLFG